ncbi:MAG: outer membrane protein transport protein [Alphaproteobacteria bacterium]|nr:outer membrane protein transport protein [Alphaproteobacteria bacterium]
MKNAFKVSLLSSVAAATVTLMTAGTAQATNGMLMHCVGVDRCGMGGAGVAMGTSATDAAINPALGAKLGNTYQVNMGMFKADIKGFSTHSANGTLAAKRYTNMESGKNYFPNGSLGVNYKLSDDSSFNIYVGPGSGGAVIWNNSRTYGFNSTSQQDTSMEYKTIHLQPSYAVEYAGAKWGVGAVLSRGTIETNAFWGSFGGTNYYGDGTTDTFYGAGFHLGTAFDLDENVHMGLAYRSPIWHRDMADTYKNKVFSSPIDIPAQIHAGVAVDATDALTIAADLKFVQYGSVQTIGNSPADLVQLPYGNVNSGFGWEDQMIYMLGVSYALTDSTTLRAGYNHGDSPIKDSMTWENMLYPAIIEDHFTVGASQKITDNMELGFSAYLAPEAKQTEDGTVYAANALTAGSWLKHKQKGFQLSFKHDF